MALDAIFDPKFKYAAQSLAPIGGTVQSSNSNNILENYGQYQTVLNSLLSSSSGNLLNTAGMLTEGLDVKASSLIRGANLALPKGHHMYGNPSTNFDANFNVLTCSSSTQSHRNKKSEVGIKDESNNYYSTIAQQLLCSIGSVQLQRQSPLLQTFFQNNHSNTKHNVLKAVPKIQGGSYLQQQQQEMTNQLPQEASIVHPLTNGACFRRLMQFMYHLCNRTHENDLTYWRDFVEEYYAPGAKKRWCFSLYESVELQALGISPHKAMDVWHCHKCGCQSGRGFEVKYEVLPRLSKLTCDNGVIDELLHVDMPRECRLASGLMMLECGRAVQETVYEWLRVVREGQLRLVFTHDLKVFLRRNMVIPHRLKNYSGKDSTAQLTEVQRVELQDTRCLARGQDLQLQKDKLMARCCGSAPNVACKAHKIISQPMASTFPDCFHRLTDEHSFMIPSVNTTKQRSRISKQKSASSNQIHSPKTSSCFAQTQISEHGMIWKILQDMINNSRAVKKDGKEEIDYGIVYSTLKVRQTDAGEKNMGFKHSTEDVTKFYIAPVPENLVGCYAGRIDQSRSAPYMDLFKSLESTSLPGEKHILPAQKPSS